MITYGQQSKILFISTFPPSKCGIASFTQDLVHAINREIKSDILINICALDKKIYYRITNFDLSAKNKSVRKKMRYYSLLKTRDTALNKVAAKHVELFNNILGRPAEKTEKFTQPVN